ncbi:hypothetical protein GF371_00195 [Candidatus Woesearchaeota archaeon]|nr:hypothetical protein [Candidatus Woesearchaeota archaeon]
MEDSKNLVGRVIKSKRLTCNSALYLNFIETIYKGDFLFLNRTPVQSLVLSTTKELSGTVAHMLPEPERYLVARCAYDLLFENINTKEQFEYKGKEFADALFPMMALVEGHLYCEPESKDD